MDTRILQFPIKNKTVYVNCQNQSEYRRYREQLPELLESARKCGAKTISFRVGSRVKCEVPTGLGKTMNAFETGPPGEMMPEAILRELLQATEEGRSLSLVEMGTDKQIFCTSHHQKFCGATWDDWIGMTARDYFPDNEYTRYIAELTYHEAISQFSYRAFRLGSGEERIFTVNARIITALSGRRFRLVETLQDEAVPVI